MENIMSDLSKKKSKHEKKFNLSPHKAGAIGIILDLIGLLIIVLSFVFPSGPELEIFSTILDLISDDFTERIVRYNFAILLSVPFTLTGAIISSRNKSRRISLLAYWNSDDYSPIARMGSFFGVFFVLVCLWPFFLIILVVVIIIIIIGAILNS